MQARTGMWGMGVLEHPCCSDRSGSWSECEGADRFPRILYDVGDKMVWANTYALMTEHDNVYGHQFVNAALNIVHGLLFKRAHKEVVLCSIDSCMLRKSYRVPISRSIRVHNNNPLAFFKGDSACRPMSAMPDCYMLSHVPRSTTRAVQFDSLAESSWFMMPRARCVHTHDIHPHQRPSQLLATIPLWFESSHRRGIAEYKCRSASSAATRKGPTCKNSRPSSWVRNYIDERNSVDSAWIAECCQPAMKMIPSRIPTY